MIVFCVGKYYNFAKCCEKQILFGFRRIKIRRYQYFVPIGTYYTTS